MFRVTVLLLPSHPHLWQSPAFMGTAEHLPPHGKCKRIPCFVLLACMDSAFPIKLFSSPPTSFLTFTLSPSSQHKGNKWPCRWSLVFTRVKSQAPQIQVTSAPRQCFTDNSSHSTAQKIASYKFGPYGEQQLTDICSFSEGSNVYLQHRPRNSNPIWWGKTQASSEDISTPVLQIIQLFPSEDCEIYVV